jgi:hypothetical protein
MDQERCLKFGDRIILKSKSQNIMLASKGSETNAAAYYVKFPDNNYLENQLFYPNCFELIFEIHPQLNYEAHAEYNDLPPGDPTRRRAEKKVILEESLNKTKLSENLNKTVYLDSIIQLYHLATGTYLQMNPQKIAESDMGVIGCTKVTTEFSQFKISLPFGFYKKGTPLNYNSSFVLVDLGKKTLAYPLTDSNWKMLQIKPFPQPKQAGYFNWFGSKEYNGEPLPYILENQSSFKGFLAGYINVADLGDTFGNSFEALNSNHYFERSDSSLLWSNNITIRKLEHSSGKLSAVISEVNKSSHKNTPLCRFIEKSESKRLIGIESVYQLIPLRNQEIGKSVSYNKSNTVFCLIKCLLSGQFLKEDTEKNELVLANDFEKEQLQITAQKDAIEAQYKNNLLRYEAGNYQPGEFNETEIERFNSKSKSYFRSNKDYFDEYLRRMTFKIAKMSSDNDPCINNSNFFKIFGPSGRTLIQADSKLKTPYPKDQNADLFTDSFQNRMQKSYIEDYKLIFSEKPDDYDLFYFQEVDRSMESILTRITAIMPSICRAPTADHFDTLFLLEYIEGIARLLQLFNEIVFERKIDRFETQNIFRQTSIIDMVMRFLSQIYEKCSQDPSLLVNAFEACDRSVYLLEILVKNNRFNSLYLFQWKNFLNSVILEGKNDILIKTNLDTLYFSIIDNLQFNWVYTEDFIQPLCSRIRFASFDRHKIEILIKILNSFKHGADERHMEVIYQSIFQESHRNEIFKQMKLKGEDSVIIEVDKNQTLVIDGDLIADEEKYTYVLLVIKLGSVLADLDLLKVSKKLSDIFPKEACTKLIEMEKLTDEFRCLVLSIYSTIYILNAVYHYKVLKFSDKVIVPDEIELSPSPHKKASNIFAESLMMKPQIVKAIERVDLGEILTNVDHKNYLNKFMEDSKSEENKAILYSSLKITMQLLDTNFFTKAEITELRAKIEKILSNDKEILASLKPSPMTRSRSAVTEVFAIRSSHTLDIDAKGLQAGKSVEITRLMDNSDDSIDENKDRNETGVTSRADHYEYIILLLNLLLKINEVIIAFELRDSLVDKKARKEARKDSKGNLDSKTNKDEKERLNTSGIERRNSQQRRSRKLKSKLAGTKIIGLGVLHLTTETHEINAERLAQLFNQLKFKNNEKMYKIIMAYFSIESPKLFFKVLDFFQKICSQKYFFFKTLRNHYLVQDELEKERYAIYKKSNFTILKSVRNISRNYSIESLASYHSELSIIVEVLRDKINEAFIHTTRESRLRQLEFNMKEQFNANLDLKMRYQLSGKEDGVLCNILNYFYMRLDCLLINQNIIWKSGFLSILLELLSFFNTRLYSKGSELRKQKFEGGALFDDGIFAIEDRVFSEVSFGILLLFYYSVYHNSQIANFILSSEGDKALNTLLSYLQSPELIIKKIALMILSMVFGSSFENVYSINKRYRSFFMAVLAEFVRESKASRLDYEILVNYVEFFKRVTDYDNLIFEKNYEMIHEAISSLQIYSQKNQVSMISHLLNTEVKECLKLFFKDKELKKIVKPIDLKKVRLQINRTRTTRSPVPRTGGNTPAGSVRAMIFTREADIPDDLDEADSIFHIAEIPNLVIYLNQLLKYFAGLATLGSNELRSNLRKLISVDSILSVFAASKELWFFKITLLDFLNAVFINQKIDLKAKGQVFETIKEVIIPDIRSHLQSRGMSKYVNKLFVKSDMTRINSLHVKRESETGVCYNHYCFEHHDSQGYYVRESALTFLRLFAAVCHHDANTGVVDSLLALVADLRPESPSAVLQQAVLELAGRFPQGSQRDVTHERKRMATLTHGSHLPRDSVDLKKAELVSKMNKLFDDEGGYNTVYGQHVDSDETDLFLIQQFLKEESPEIDKTTVENVKDQYHHEFNDLNLILKVELEKLWKGDVNCYWQFIHQCCYLLSNSRSEPSMLRLVFKFLEEQINIHPEKEKKGFIDELLKAQFVANFFNMISQREKDRGLIFKALNFLKQLLTISGNKIQVKMYEELIKESDNKFSNVLLKYWDESITNFYELDSLKYQLHNPHSKVKYHRESLEEKLDDKYDKQIESITTILEVMRLMCEDHFSKLQNYLRIQTLENGLLKPSQVNFIEKVILFFKQYTKLVQEDNAAVASHLLRFLTETVQGPCRENQAELIKKKLLEPLEDLHCNLIYANYALKKESRVAFVNLILVLKLGVIESTRDSFVVKTLAIGLNLELVWLRVMAVYCQVHGLKLRAAQVTEAEAGAGGTGGVGEGTGLESHSLLSKDLVNNLMGIGDEKPEESAKIYKVDKQSNYSISMVEALNSMILINQLQNYGEEISDLIENSFSKVAVQYKLVSKARKFFTEKIQSIEFIDSDQNLQTLFFYIHPKTNFLSAFSILKFEENVDRKNWTSKITALMNFIPQSYLEIKHNYTLYSRLGIHVSVSSFYVFKLVNFFLAIIVNIMFMVYREFPNEVDTEEVFRPWSEADNVQKSAQILCFIMIINYGLAFLLYIVYEFVVKLEIIFLDQTKEEEHHVFHGSTRMSRSLVRLRRFIKLSHRVLFHTKFLQISGLLLACFLGLFKSKMYFAFVLLDIIDISPVLLNVIRSVTFNFAALSTTWLLIMIVVFIYSSIAYFSAAIKHNMVPLDQPELDVCSNFAMCYWNMMIFGIKSGGGIGDIMSVPDHRVSQGDYASRTLFDMIFFMSIILICMNIILGIIIDSFAELRDIRNAILHDIENVCFVCEMTKQEFNNNGLSFMSHTRQAHYIWNYVYYIVGLLEKDPSEYNGIESFIAAKYKAGDIDWIPYHKTALLKKKLTDENSSKEKRMVEIEEKLEMIVRMLKKDENKNFRD